MKSILSNWYIWAVALVFVIAFIRGRKSAMRRYIAAGFFWSGAILALQALLALVSAHGAKPPVGGLPDPLLDRVTTLKPKVKNISGVDFMIDISGTVSAEEALKRIKYFNGNYTLTDCNYYAFGSFLRRITDVSVAGIDRLRLAAGRDSVKLKSYTDITAALAGYIDSLTDREHRTCVVITDDNDEPVPGHPHKSLEELQAKLAANSQVYFYLVRVKGKVPKGAPVPRKFISENLGQFFIVDSVSAEGTSQQYAGKLAGSVLLSDIRPWVSAPGADNEKMTVLSANLDGSTGVIKATVRSNYRFWPVLMHVTGLTVEERDYNADAYLFLEPRGSDSVSLYVSSVAAGWLPVNYTHKTGLKLKYDLYFAGSDGQPLIRKAADFKVAEGALKGLFYQSYTGGFPAMMVLHRVGAGALAVYSALLLLVAWWLAMYRKPTLNGYSYKVRNIPHNKWVGEGEMADREQEIKNEYDQVIGKFAARKSALSLNLLFQPLDRITRNPELLKTGNGVYKSGQEYEIHVSRTL